MPRRAALAAVTRTGTSEVQLGPSTTEGQPVEIYDIAGERKKSRIPRHSGANLTVLLRKRDKKGPFRDRLCEPDVPPAAGFIAAEGVRARRTRSAVQ